MKNLCRSTLVIMTATVGALLMDASPAYGACATARLWVVGAGVWSTAAKWNAADVPNTTTESATVSTTGMTSIGGTYNISCMTVSAVFAPGSASTIGIAGDSFTATTAAQITSGSTYLTVSMNGSAIPQTYASVNDIYNLIINNSTGQTVTITHASTLGAGGLTFANGNTGIVSVAAALTLPAATPLTIPAGAKVSVTSTGTLNALGGIVVNGTLELLAGANVKIGDGKTLSVPVGGTLKVTGASGSLGTISVHGTASSSTKYNLTVAGSIDASYFQFSHLTTAGVNITGNVVKLENGKFTHLASSGYGVTMGAGATRHATTGSVWRDMLFTDDWVFNNVKAIDATAYTSGGITVSGVLGLIGGSSYETDPGNKINWPVAATFTVGCSPTANSGTSTLSAAGTGFLLGGTTSCARTSTRFTKLLFTSTTGAAPHASWDTGGSNYAVYGVHTGDTLVVPPIVTGDVRPSYNVTAACPTVSTDVNWLYVKWDPNTSSSLVGTYVAGVSSVTTGTGSTQITRQFDVVGTTVWNGTYTPPQTTCSNGVVVAIGTGDAAATSTYAADGSGVYQAKSGRSTFFFPQQTATLSSFGNLTFSGLQYDSSSANGINDTKAVKVVSNAAGTVYTVTPYSNVDTGAIDASFTDTITITQANAPIGASSAAVPGMHLATVTRTGTGAGGPTNLICISHFAAAKGTRIICSGQTPGASTIPYSITMVETATTYVAGPSCPSNYVPVAANGTLGTAAFCVAKYEMKNVGGAATSTSAGAPWVSIARSTLATTAGGAWKACRDIGAGYDLISTRQWTAIAREIEIAGAPTYTNWSNNSIAGANAINRGHSDNSPANTLAASTDDDPCYLTGQTNCATVSHTDFRQKRTHTLASGDIIWDFAGNAMEWTQSSPGTLKANTYYSTKTWDGTQNANETAATRLDFGPSGSYTAKNSGEFGGLGYGALNGSSSIVRGNRYNAVTAGTGTESGIFHTMTASAPITVSAVLGFRCVYIAP